MRLRLAVRFVGVPTCAVSILMHPSLSSTTNSETRRIDPLQFSHPGSWVLPFPPSSRASILILPTSPYLFASEARFSSPWDQTRMAVVDLASVPGHNINRLVGSPSDGDSDNDIRDHDSYHHVRRFMNTSSKDLKAVQRLVMMYSLEAPERLPPASDAHFLAELLNRDAATDARRSLISPWRRFFEPPPADRPEPYVLLFSLDCEVKRADLTRPIFPGTRSQRSSPWRQRSSARNSSDFRAAVIKMTGLTWKPTSQPSKASWI